MLSPSLWWQLFTQSTNTISKTSDAQIPKQFIQAIAVIEDSAESSVVSDSATKDTTRTPESKGRCRVDPGRVRLGVDSVNSAELRKTRPSRCRVGPDPGRLGTREPANIKGERDRFISLSISRSLSPLCVSGSKRRKKNHRR